MSDKPIVTLPVGGTVAAIIPQSFEEIQRIANTIIAGGLAPASLLKRVRDDATPEERKNAAAQNIAGVAAVLMAGAELGIPPMSALRMMTVINGRPALYADGNVSVVRKSKGTDGKPVAEFIRNGFTVEHDFICPVCAKRDERQGRLWTHMLLQHPAEAEKLKDTDLDDVFEAEESDRSYAWAEAKRADTGEVMHEQFSVADAKRAGLWDAAETVGREVWEYDATKGKRAPIFKQVPNDSPWHRYPHRMMMWRAAGYMLRWLFADVLSGMADEYEAREIARPMLDVTPPRQVDEDRPTRPRDSAIEMPDIPLDDPAPATEDQSQDVTENPAPPAAEPAAPAKLDDLAVAEYLEMLGRELDGAATEPDVEQAFDDADPQTKLAGDDLAIEEAFAMKRKRIDEIARAAK